MRECTRTSSWLLETDDKEASARIAGPRSLSHGVPGGDVRPAADDRWSSWTVMTKTSSEALPHRRRRSGIWARGDAACCARSVCTLRVAGVRFRRHHDDRRRIVSAVGGSVGLVLCVGFAVLGGARFLVRPGVSHDAGRSVLVAVRCVLDECLLGEFEPLGLASSGLVHGTALLAFTLGAIDDGFVRSVVIHGPNCTASAQAPDSEKWDRAFPYLSGDPAEGEGLARRSRKFERWRAVQERRAKR